MGTHLQKFKPFTGFWEIKYYYVDSLTPDSQYLLLQPSNNVTIISIYLLKVLLNVFNGISRTGVPIHLLNVDSLLRVTGILQKYIVSFTLTADLWALNTPTLVLQRRKESFSKEEFAALC